MTTAKCQIQILRNFNGLSCVCFLKKLLKCVSSQKPNAYAISDTFHALCFRRIFDSRNIRSPIIWEVVFSVVSFTERFKWLTWTFNCCAKSEADRRLSVWWLSSIGNWRSSSSKNKDEILCEALIGCLLNLAEDNFKAKCNNSKTRLRNTSYLWM